MIERFANRLYIPLKFVANRLIPIPPNNLFTMIVTGKHESSADEYIVAHVTENDIAVTRDIQLAARLVEKRITVLNDRGIEYSSENVQERVSLRNFHLHLFETGVVPEKTHTYSRKDLTLFANNLDRALQKRRAARNETQEAETQTGSV
ncbi:DUF188 domain-containing protein [Treponema endosymbiont of Eucomonympha sp.]|uniref:DUF188 domain-containing protein n=2 Tax=Treponema endosymbiont of Eucomonympha sp. TaxID=1580831 RepID=UPI0007516F02|nr:DUF188 domain-containing protein [Treponema endosymbiont of Eucomonympha sp.]